MSDMELRQSTDLSERDVIEQAEIANCSKDTVTEMSPRVAQALQRSQLRI